MTRLTLDQKLAILSDAAKYDASCASSGSTRRDSRDGKSLGSNEGSGICHAYAPDGRCISLLKILMTNFCIYDCAYCINRASSNVARARFSIDEVVKLTIEFYRRNYIEGLFLSSGIIQSPDATLERLVETADEFAVGLVNEPLRRPLELAFAEHKYELHSEQFVEREPAARHLLFTERVRCVDCLDRLRSRNQAQALQDLARHRVGDPSLVASAQRLLDPARQLPRTELGLLALRVDRDDLAGPVTDLIDDRVRHLEPTSIRVGLAKKRHLEALLELPLAPWLVEEHDLHPARAITDLGGHHRPPIAGRALRDGADGHEHERFFTGDEISDARLVGAVNPATGVRRDQVEHRVDVKRPERTALLLPDALDLAHIDRREVAERDRRPVIHDPVSTTDSGPVVNMPVGTAASASL